MLRLVKLCRCARPASVTLVLYRFKVWSLLKPGGVLVCYETPNRLNYFDWHSYLLPFFNQLPDSLAILYAKKTPRPFFSAQGSSETERIESMYRLGRGVSYHEFELAIGLEQMTVINDGFSERLSHRRPLDHPTFGRALLEIFCAHLPKVPAGFSRPSLDLILLKGDDLERRRYTSASAVLARLYPPPEERLARKNPSRALAELRRLIKGITPG